MTQSEVAEAVMTAITDIQEKSGDEAPELRPDTTPIGGIPGFDSLRGLELSVSMGRIFRVPDDVNLCVSDDGTRALTVAEITAKLMALGEKSTEEVADAD